jgi:hypothetical protein
MKRVNEGEYGQHTFFTCMKTCKTFDSETCQSFLEGR